MGIKALEDVEVEFLAALFKDLERVLVVKALKTIHKNVTVQRCVVVRATELPPIKEPLLKDLKLLDIFSSLNDFIKDVIGDIVLDDDPWEQKINVVPVRMCV